MRICPAIFCIIRCEIRLITGGWSKTEAEIQAVNSLADQGADVVTCHVDSPKAVLETAKKRGMMTCGYHANGSAINPETYLTGAEWNWAPHPGGAVLGSNLTRA